MRFEILKHSIMGYYIVINGNKRDLIYDDEIAQLLSLSLDEYYNILTKWSSSMMSEAEEHYFKNREDAQNAIEELEPYLMMVNLVGE